MKALYLDQLTGNPEHLQKKNSQTIMGAKVFEWNLLCAVLKYGTYDAYFAPGVTDQGRDALIENGLNPESVKRLVPVPLGSPLPVPDSARVVLLTAGRHLDVLATLRERLQRYDAPICGFIHSINSTRIALTLLQQCFVGLSEADLLLCSSRAGMKTIDAYIDRISRLLPLGARYPARRVLVPLAVNIPISEPEHSQILRQRLNVESTDTIVLYFGRLSQTSKCDLGPLVVALSQLLRRRTKLHLIIAGDDSQTKEGPRLQALGNELGCQKHVTVWTSPSAEDKHLLYSGADIFVSPSDNIQETFGLTVAEAMAYGLPVIVSDWNGYRDLVKDGENGFLVRSILPPDIDNLRLCDSTTSMLQEDLLAQSTAIDVGILSERLGRLATSRSLRVEMGRAARRYMEDKCSWPVIVKRYEDLWRESLEIIKGASVRSSSRLLTLPLEECFGHYATAKRGRESRCFITKEGQEWLKRPSRLYFLSKLSAVPCPRKFTDVLAHIAASPGLSVTKVVESFVDGSDPVLTTDTYWMLARLFKYGLVSEVADNQSQVPSSERAETPRANVACD